MSDAQAFDYDLFVIGGGSGGVRAARIAAGEGKAKVALAEEYRLGGTCVIRGCVPKKLMVFASAFPGQIEDAAAYGWQASVGSFDWTAFRGKLDAELDRLEAAYRSGQTGAGVTLYAARATLAGSHSVRLSTGEEFTAKHILIAVGGRPMVPDLPGAELGLTSNEMFLLDQLPESILVVGGGYIACEFACILHGLGVKVTQAYRGRQILRGFDLETTGYVQRAMVERGIDLRLESDLAKLEKAEGGIRVTDTNGGTATYGAVLFATGRVPNSQGLGLEELGVKLGVKGEIIVDDYSQTSVPSIFAVGDVTDRVNLTPVAIREGHAFADTVFKGQPRTADHSLIPAAVFAQPELGTVGLSEEEAAARGAIEIYSTSFRPMQTLFAGRDDRAFFKLVVCASTRKVLGCHIVAPSAGELIQLVAIAIRMGATKEDFDRTMAVHPTIAEELVTMRNPVRTVGTA